MGALTETADYLRKIYAETGVMPDVHYVSAETLREIEREAESMALVYDPSLKGRDTKLLGVPIKTFTAA
jgi:hypothetical protein